MQCRKNGVITVLCDALAWAGPCVAVPPFLFTLAVEVCWTCAVRIRAIEAALLSLVLLRLMLGSISGEDGFIALDAWIDEWRGWCTVSASLILFRLHFCNPHLPASTPWTDLFFVIAVIAAVGLF